MKNLSLKKISQEEFDLEYFRLIEEIEKFEKKAALISRNLGKDESRLNALRGKEFKPSTYLSDAKKRHKMAKAITTGKGELRKCVARIGALRRYLEEHIAIGDKLKLTIPDQTKAQ